MIYYILALIVIVIAEGVPLVKKRLWRELSVFFCLIIFVVFLAIARELGISSPVGWLHQLIGPAGEAIFNNSKT